MFARFNENPAMTLQDIKETKCYGGTHGQTDGRENSIPPTNKVCGGYKNGKFSAIGYTLQLFEVIWKTAANTGETFNSLVQKNMRGFFALYRMKFDSI